MIAVLDAVVPVFALVLIGYICARRGLLGDAAGDVLNTFVVWLALPSLLFNAMAQISWAEINEPGFFFALLGGMMIVFGLSFVERRGRALADRSINGLNASYPNTGYMGIPLCLAAFGPESLPPAVVGTLLTTCALFAVSIVLIEIDLQKEPGLWRMAKKVALSLARNPLLAAPAMGLVVSGGGFELPSPVARLTSLLAAAASPCALVTIGLFLARTPGAGAGTLVARLVAMKLLVQPAITAVLAFYVFSMPLLWAQVALLLSALPTGTGPFMLAKLYDRDTAATSRAILLSTVISVATISALVAFFNR